MPPAVTTSSPVAELREHVLVFLGALLLRADQQEIEHHDEDDEDQDLDHAAGAGGRSRPPPGRGRSEISRLMGKPPGEKKVAHYATGPARLSALFVRVRAVAGEGGETVPSSSAARICRIRSR